MPQGQYLLDKANVKCTDDKSISTNDLRNYLRQKQNNEILGFWKLNLHLYNTAPIDTTTKAKRNQARLAHKLGEPPVIYDEDQTRASMHQLKQQMTNMGYFQAEVDTQKVIKDRKVRMTYIVTAHQPYTIRHYEVDIPLEEVRRIALDKQRSLVKEGDQFSSAALDEERARITTAIRNQGYYYFEKSMLEFTADSSYQTHEVDVKIHLAPFLDELDSATLKRLRTRYTIRDVNFTLDHPFLRKNTLRRVCRIKEGKPFAEWRVDRTYARMNALPPVKYVDIAFAPVEGIDTLLDCNVSVSRARLNSISAEVEGTYSGGDWGIAAGLNYSNKNIFHGAEVLTVGAKASYEWRANGGRAVEGKAEVGLLFPSNVNLSIGCNYQQRPDEYTRTIANANLGYIIPRRPGGHWTHQFDLLDINYIYLPWMSTQFKEDFINRSSVLKASYEDQFIVDWSYMCSYTSFNPRHPDRSYVQLAFRVETAGNALYELSKVCGFSTNEKGNYLLWKIPFSQYAKGDFNCTFHGVIKPQHQLVTHVGFGVAVPYLNSDVVPFIKRYFAGGASGVRGWQARSLGPGTFHGDGTTLTYELQSGDIHLDLNLEYRYKVLKFLELAAFTDAGNIWTIDDYITQPGGKFYWDEFYKQLGWSCGVGVRFDLSILLFRIDFGVKLYDPGRINENKQWRTAENGLGWRNDMTFHFAVGYPF